MAKFCANCGSELQDNQDVCLKCGVNVSIVFENVLKFLKH